jgi:hypothetical protein
MPAEARIGRPGAILAFLGLQSVIPSFRMSSSSASCGFRFDPGSVVVPRPLTPFPRRRPTFPEG